MGVRTCCPNWDVTVIVHYQFLSLAAFDSIREVCEVKYLIVATTDCLHNFDCVLS